MSGTTQEEGEIPDAVAPGVATRFAARVPIDKTIGNWSLIVALHGMSNGPRIETRLLYYPSLGLLQHAIQTRYVVLGLAAQAEGKGWADVDEPAITAAVTWALARWPIDPRRVYAYGISNGAMRLGHFAPRHSSLFASVVAMSGNVTGIAPDIPPERDLRWYLMHGDADPVVGVAQSRDGAAALKAAGFPVVYREFTGQGHIYGKPVTDTCHADAVHWLETLRLTSTPTAAEDTALTTLRSWIGGNKKPATKPTELMTKLVSMAGAAVDALVADGLAAADAPVRTQFANLCVMRQYGPKSDAGLLPLLADRDAAVRTATIQAIGLRANWQDLAARDALIALVKDPKGRGPDRSEALMQLGANLRLQRLCAGGPDANQEMFTGLSTGTDAKLAALAKQALTGAFKRGLDGHVAVPGKK